MGLIINENTGGGGGDATAANQTTQITEAQILNDFYLGLGPQTIFTDSTGPSVFLDNPGGNKSVFYDQVNNKSTFIDQVTNKSAFIDQTTGQSALNTLLLRQQPTSTTTVSFLQNATFAGLAALVQADLRANTAKVILNISYIHDTGGTPWHAFITYR